MEQGVVMSKRAVLMMTFGSPEEITYEGVAEFSRIYAVGGSS